MEAMSVDDRNISDYVLPLDLCKQLRNFPWSVV